MSTQCASCQETFAPGDYVQPLPPVIQLRMGEKSGQLGWYPEGGPETEYVHIECVQAYYQVEDTPVWGEIDTNLREAVRREEREAIEEEVLRRVAESGGGVCQECLEEIDLEDLEEGQEVYRTPV